MAFNTLEEARAIWRDAPANDETLSLYLEAANAACLAYATPSPTPFTIVNGFVVSSDSIDGNETELLPGVFLSVSADSEWVAGESGIPAAWKIAEVLQARNIYNSSKASAGSDDFSGGGYGLTTTPLDWQVKQLLRPRRALGFVA